MSLLKELERRNVIRVAVAYLAGAWLLIQVLETLFPIFDLQETAIRIVVIILAIGFLPAVVIAWTFQITPGGVVKDDGQHELPASASRRLDRAIIVALSIAVVLFAIHTFVLSPADPQKDEEKSIAIMPLDDLSPGADKGYLTLAVLDGLISSMQSVQDIRVISRGTVEELKRQNLSTREIAERLDVVHVLEGSLITSGDETRINVRVIVAEDDSQLFASVYTEPTEDTFGLIDKISADVSESLATYFDPALLQRQEVDPRAHELYLRARFLLNNLTEENNETAWQLLEETLRIQPDYSDALAERARAMLNYFDGTEIERTAAIRREVDKLVALDPDGLAALRWQGWIAMVWDNDYRTAAEYLERALEGDPTEPRTIRHAASLFSRIGDYDRAIEIANYVVQRDPACNVCVSALAYAYRRAGRHREAAEALEGILEWHPPSAAINWGTGVSWLIAGEPEKAITFFEGQPGSNELGYLMAIHDLGRQEEFEAGLARLIDQAESDTELAESVARIYAYTGDADNAFKYLDLMIAEMGPQSALQVKTDLYDNIKSDPRWGAFLRRNGAEDRDIEKINFNPRLPDELMEDV